MRTPIDQPQLSLARSSLRDYKTRTESILPPEFWQNLSQVKYEAVAADDQLTAKASWCLATVGLIQDTFVSAFWHIRGGKFQEAWGMIAQCESALNGLDRHFTEVDSEFGIEFIRTHTRQFQDLFPLKWGMSLGLLVKERRCSICDAVITLRSGCTHEWREIYNGEMCVPIVERSEMLHVALVDNPFQKSTMIFPKGDDAPQLVPLKDLADALLSPWRSWSYRKEERKKHHPAFKGLGRNDICPCESGLKYKRCCLNKDKVYPHFLVSIGKDL